MRCIKEKMKKDELEALKKESMMYGDSDYGVCYVASIDETILFRIYEECDGIYNVVGWLSRHGNYKEPRSVLHKFTWWFIPYEDIDLEVFKWFVFEVWGYPRDEVHEFCSALEFLVKYEAKAVEDPYGENQKKVIMKEN
ncbi:hypothetical protein [Blautia sp. MSJ-36]|uniref:hypothetical protein n=1 Tax=Blautia sp. MSJ-36 TaxID=2841530 RepID=UPI001C0FD399|nr:hypothetical protein [Blautia sp. MSJ-36]MBU5446313.1 hypothetical protein [Blautia sp. MSJ-36]